MAFFLLLTSMDCQVGGAIAQIKDKQYADWIREYTSEILLVGISYDKKRDMPVSLRSISYDL